jgi:hypothetical protein
MEGSTYFTEEQNGTKGPTLDDDDDCDDGELVQISCLSKNIILFIFQNTSFSCIPHLGAGMGIQR